MCTTILPTKLWDQNFDFFAFNFLWIFNYKNLSKFGILKVFGHFLKVFDAWPLNLVYRHIVGTFKCVWKITLWAKFSAAFWYRTGPKYVNMWVFVYFLEHFPLNHRKLYLLAHWSYFYRCVEDRPQRDPIFGSVWAPNRSKFNWCCACLDCETFLCLLNGWCRMLHSLSASALLGQWNGVCVVYV